MKYFEEIYEAAKNRDKKALRHLFKKGACIDTRSNTKSLITPAGLLAEEGDLESANYLVDFFGANPVFVAQGLLLANNDDEANKCLKFFEIKKSLIFSDLIDKTRKTIRHFAFKADIKPDTVLRHDTNHEAKMVTGEFTLKDFKKLDLTFHSSNYLDAAAHAGHIYLLEKIHSELASSPLPSLNSLFARPTFRADVGFPVYRLQTEKLALHALSFIKSDKFLAAILNRFKKPAFERPPYDVEAVMNQARKIRTIMKSDGIGYSEALALCDQRQIDLPPLLQTSLPFYKKTTHITTNPDTSVVSVQVNRRFSF